LFSVILFSLCCCVFADGFQRINDFNSLTFSPLQFLVPSVPGNQSNFFTYKIGAGENPSTWHSPTNSTHFAQMG